jgi:N-acetylneuraminic acid mutarotase
MPGARSSFGLVAVGSKLYALGGAGSSPSRIYVYDPSADVWSVAKSAMPAPRMAAAYVGTSGRIYVIGGAQGTGSTARVDIYDVAADKWSSAAQLPSPRQSLSAAIFGDSIHVVGGQSIDPPKTYADHFVLNMKTGSWSKSASLRTARHASVAMASGGKLYVIGGSPGAGVYTVFTQSDVMEIFTPSK